MPKHTLHYSALLQKRWSYYRYSLVCSEFLWAFCPKAHFSAEFIWQNICVSRVNQPTNTGHKDCTQNMFMSLLQRELGAWAQMCLLKCRCLQLGELDVPGVCHSYCLKPDSPRPLTEDHQLCSQHWGNEHSPNIAEVTKQECQDYWFLMMTDRSPFNFVSSVLKVVKIYVCLNTS